MLLFRSFLVFLGFSTQLLLAAECSVPKPFRQLTATEAKHYVAEEIIAKTKLGPDTSIHQPQITERASAKLINFWASWCAPCREELPLLDELTKTTKVTIQLVNIGDSQTVVNQVFTALDIQNLVTYQADSQLLSALSLAGLPATLVWSQKHKAVFLAMGKLNQAKSLSQWLGCL